MPRKGHTKSRLGCRQCKRRHLKCDETRPKCVNCKTANIRCPYEDESHSSDLPTPEQDESQAESHHASQVTTPSDHISPFQRSSVDTTPLNLVHLELMHVWSSGLYKAFHLTPENYELYSNACVQNGMQHPFLMRQVLATAALSLSVTNPDRRDYYHQHAARLQAEAVSGFYAIAEHLTESNVVAAFLMSTLIGLHALCETFTFRAKDLNTVLDSLVECMRLCRGVKVVISSWWPFLQRSALGPFLTSTGDRLAQAEHRIQLSELRTMLSVADMGEHSRKVYEDSIHELENVYSAEAAMEGVSESSGTRMLMSWPVTMPAEFIDQLSARRAEALVILAYWGVLLHRDRGSWALGNAGEILIHGITEYLGKHWERWLAQPLAAIA